MTHAGDRDDTAIYAPSEPDLTQFGGTSPMRVVKRYAMATRPAFYTASLMPVIVGTAWGLGVSGRLDWIAAVLALLGMTFGHGAANVINDVYDELSGNDRMNAGRIHPFSGGSRFIQNGIIGVRAMIVWSVALMVCAAVVGGLLIAHAGPGILWFGLALFAVVCANLLPPAQLNYKGLGEVMVALGFGVLPVTMAVWLQTGELDTTALLLSLPVALWIANVLLINEIPDREADAACGKTTLVVLLGARGAAVVYLAANAAALGGVAGLAANAGLNPAILLLPALLLAFAVRAALPLLTGQAGRPAMTRAIKTTLAIHGAGCVWLAAWAAV